MRTICLIATLCLSALIANAQTWPGGMDGSTYIITTAGQLDSMRYFLNKDFRLGNDIDLSDFMANHTDPDIQLNGWKPIGSYDNLYLKAFTGKIDGNGYVIKNLRINRPSEDYVGLFGYMIEQAAITNLCVYIATDGVTGGRYVGGLVGYVDNPHGATITPALTQCRVMGNVTGQQYVGGIVGYMYAADNASNNINQSRYEGTVNGTDNVGGIAGLLKFGGIKDSYAMASVRGQKNVGGLVGKLIHEARLRNSYAMGDIVAGVDSVGGVIGKADSDEGNNKVAKVVAITNRVTGTANTGRVIGYIETSGYGNAIDTTFSYIATQGTTSGSYIVNGTYKPLDSLQSESFYADSVGFDFNNVWTIKLDVSPYPILQSIKEVEQSFSGFIGNGSDTIPYRIYSGAQLDSMRNHLNKSFILMNDIDLGYYIDIKYGDAGWQPIGTITNPFKGKLFGNKFVIKNLRINTTTPSSGLFAYMQNAYIDSLGVYVNSLDSIKGSDVLGIIAGTIDNTLIRDSYAKGSVRGGNTIGGMVGYMKNGSKIMQSYATGSVKGTSGVVGGLIGQMENSRVVNCYTLNNVLGRAGTLGGIVALGLNSSVDSCVAINPSINGVDKVGRIAGVLDIYSTETKNYAYGNMFIPANGDQIVNGTSATISELQTQGFYETQLNWNFTDSLTQWAISSEGNSFPHLAWEVLPDFTSTPSTGGCSGVSVTYSFNATNASGIQWVRYDESSADAIPIGTTSPVNTILPEGGNTLVSVEYYDESAQRMAHLENMLFVNASYNRTVYANTCQGRPYRTMYGVSYTVNTVGDTVIVEKKFTVAGCDSLLTTHLSVKPSYTKAFNNATTFTATVDFQSTLSPWPVEMPFQGTFNANTAGIKDTTLVKTSEWNCDSLVVYRLIVRKGIADIAVTPATKTYGDPNPTITVTVYDTLGTPLNPQPATSYTCAATVTSPVGAYLITPELMDTNYIVRNVTTANLTVTARTTTITANSVSRQYGNANPAFSSTFSNVIQADSAAMQAALQYACSATATSPVATYTITPSLSPANANYAITFIDGTLTVAAREITVTADNLSRPEFPNVDPPLTYTYTPTPLVGTDAFTGTLSRVPGALPGTYDINQGTLALNSNYNITFNKGAFTIYKTPILTWTQTLPDGCNGVTTVTLAGTSDVTGAGTPPITYESSNPAVASVAGNVLTIHGPGVATITAYQHEDLPVYHEALPIAKILTAGWNPAAFLIKKWDNTLVFNNEAHGYKAYKWYKNGTIIPNVTSQTYYEQNKLSGSFYVEMLSIADEWHKTCPWNVTPSPAPVSGEVLKLYPNPVSAGQVVNLEINLRQEALQNAFIHVMDVNGNIVKTVNVIEPTMQINVPSRKGYYMIVLYRDNAESVVKTILVQ